MAGCRGHRRPLPRFFWLVPLWAAPALLVGVAEEVPDKFQRLRDGVAADRRKVAKKMRKPAPPDLPAQSWGDVLLASGLFGSWDDIRARKDVEPMWSRASLHDVMHKLKRVPLQPSFGSASLILESRLAEGQDDIDFSIKYNPYDFPTLLGNPVIQEMAQTSPQWKLIRDFFKMSSSKPGAHQELWIEMDQATGPESASVFVGPATWLRDMLVPKEVAQKLGVNESELVADEVLQFLDPILKDVWAPFWSFMPWLERTQDAVRRTFVDILLATDGVFSFYQVGFWLSRDTGMLRGVMEAERIYDEPYLYNDTEAWWNATRKDLEAIGWRWEDETQPRLLDEVMPQVLVGISHFFIAINVAGGHLHPKIGFEFYFDSFVFEDSIEEHGDAAVPRKSVDPEAFFDALVEVDACTNERADAALFLGGKWDGGKKKLIRHGGFKYTINTKVNHVKVTFEPGRPVEAKVYWGAQLDWKNKKGAWWRQPAAADGRRPAAEEAAVAAETAEAAEAERPAGQRAEL